MADLMDCSIRRQAVFCSEMNTTKRHFQQRNTALLRKLFRMTTCMRCFGCRWVCEAHPHMAWEGEYACGCGAPGMPCPACNKPAEGEMPRMPAALKQSSIGAADGIDG